jgi:hypothetical protein
VQVWAHGTSGSQRGPVSKVRTEARRSRGPSERRRRESMAGHVSEEQRSDRASGASSTTGEL